MSRKGIMTKVLVIDDSAFFRQYLGNHLKKVGYEVEEFEPHSALEALERIRDIAPDLVISDYHMPDVDGLSVARMAKRVNPVLPVIILTATRDADREASLLALGVRRVLHKPITEEQLVQAVKEVLGA
jgi:CheY-like chemotaxis protein